MAQHFLLTAAARTLSLKAIFTMPANEVHAAFAAVGLHELPGVSQLGTLY